ncbi:hypothetical protein PpBr36_04517 [Pyricularia pennisetigena]|uniref:hypothetical protein n=1 Tax=Pyricularia pennisetigena TaxID=1578925 RepID=UPI0011521F83|nr:hypothetical protein PpBr36_04517 [Pyricularia pennisetigena]TLS26937.1 hypothetical protein PpBr36_04517 [Pyricularia pennisetigena]
MAANTDTSLPDEIQWNSMEHVMQFGGIHDNTILYYFAASPFFDPTSNNAVVFSQAVRNQSQLHIIATRQAFEARLREMSGLEYIVAQEPAETGPGMGTGVWVIRKQTRRKVKDSNGFPAPDEIEVHSDYFVVGENIYMAPSLANILSSRILTNGLLQASIASSITKTFPIADSIKKWSPALGHGYKTPTTNPRPRGTGLESKEATPMPESQTTSGLAASKSVDSSAPDERLAEESFAIHTHYGTEYMDENPITGKPGDFHFSSTGRKERLGIPGQQQGKAIGNGPGTPLPMLKTLPDNSPLSKDAKSDKTGKTGGPPKPKRRKSKGGPNTPS